MANVKNVLASQTYLHNDLRHFEYFFEQSGREQSMLNQALTSAYAALEQIKSQIRGSIDYLKSMQQSFFKQSGFDVSNKTLNELKAEYQQKEAGGADGIDTLSEYLKKGSWFRNFMGWFRKDIQKQLMGNGNFNLDEVAKKAFISTLNRANTLKRTADARKAMDAFTNWFQKQGSFDIEIISSITNVRGSGREQFSSYIKRLEKGLIDSGILADKLQAMISKGGIKEAIDLGDIVIDISSPQDDFAVFEGSQEKSASITNKTNRTMNLGRYFKVPIEESLDSVMEQMELDNLSMGGISFNNYAILYPIINYMQLTMRASVDSQNAGQLSEILQLVHAVILMLSAYKINEGIMRKVKMNITQSMGTYQSILNKVKADNHFDNAEMTLDWQFVNNFIIPTIVILQQILDFINQISYPSAAVKFSDLTVTAQLFSEGEMMNLHTDKMDALGNAGYARTIEEWVYPNDIVPVGAKAGTSIANSIELHTNARVLTQRINAALQNLVTFQS